MAKTARARSATRPGSRRGWWVLLGMLAVLGAAAWYYRTPITGYSQIATSYSARIACSCHYIAGRSMGDCAKDKLDGMELVTLAANEDAKSVTARFPLIAANTAYFREGYGCVLEKWEK